MKYMINKIKLQKKNLKLFYKKSENYDSYNYLKKFYKNIMTFIKKNKFKFIDY